MAENDDGPAAPQHDVGIDNQWADNFPPLLQPADELEILPEQAPFSSVAALEVSSVHRLAPQHDRMIAFYRFLGASAAGAPEVAGPRQGGAGLWKGKLTREAATSRIKAELGLSYRDALAEVDDFLGD
jgi:hypothetical protein